MAKTGEEQEFDYGIVNNAAQEIANPLMLVTHEPDGNYGKTPADKYIPATYTQIVYFNDNDPDTATIFDTENPPTTNDPDLEEDTTNLYIGTDTSTWVYKTGTGYETKVVPSYSNFYLNGTTVDGGNDKTSPINRPSPVSVMEVGVEGISVWKFTLSMWKYILGIPAYINTKITNITESYDVQFPNKTGGVEQTFAMVSDLSGLQPKGVRITNATTTGSYAINWNAGDVWDLILTGTTTITDTNLPTGTATKVIEKRITGAYALNLPAYWTALPSSEAYDGAKINHIVVTCINGTTGSEVVYYSNETTT